MALYKIECATSALQANKRETQTQKTTLKEAHKLLDITTDYVRTTLKQRKNNKSPSRVVKESVKIGEEKPLETQSLLFKLCLNQS